MTEWQQLDLRFNEDGNTMNETGDVDQFQLLEQKIDGLIELITDLRNEKTLLAEKVQTQEQKISELRMQVESLNANRDRAKQKIVSLLEKIEHIEI